MSLGRKTKGEGPLTLVLTTQKDRPEPEREVLFSIDDVDYTIPVRFSANVALQFARTTLLRGPEIAVSWALETALGERGHAALMAYDDLEPEHLEIIVTTICTRIAAGMEAPKGGLRAV